MESAFTVNQWQIDFLADCQAGAIGVDGSDTVAGQVLGHADIEPGCGGELAIAQTLIDVQGLPVRGFGMDEITRAAVKKAKVAQGLGDAQEIAEFFA